MAFTPLELLFGRRPRGHLDMDKEAWEEQPSPFIMTIKHIKDMQERICKVTPIVCQHMLSAQAKQSCHYNHSAQPQEFQPSES